MTQILDNLVALLSLEPIEENLFRGMSQDLGFRQLYGGQVLGQALSAASRSMATQAQPTSGTSLSRQTSATTSALARIAWRRSGGWRMSTGT